MKALILVLLLLLPPWHKSKETPEARRTRLEPVAAAIADASTKVSRYPESRRRVAITLLAQGWWETKFDEHIQIGACFPWECDEGKARGFWQLHEKTSRGRWGELLGLGYEPSRVGAGVAAPLALWGLSRCRGTVGGWHAHGFAGFVGGGCAWLGAQERAQTARWLDAAWSARQ